jgi:ABC-2 type transport system ATP-binding protein
MESGPPEALRIEGLNKSYPVGRLHQSRSQVLFDLDLTLRTGEVFGYLGPNGAGKSTTLKALLGLIAPDSGCIHILGHPHESPAWRYRVGYLPETPYFYDYLTAREYLDYVGRLFSLGRQERRSQAAGLLEAVGLLRSADIPLRRFSKGMVQRLGIAQALVNDPDLVLLDEPMSGLDPLGRRMVRNLILSLKARGKTVLFSTHILPDAETLCDRVGLIRSGRMVRVGPLDSILEIDVAHMEVHVAGVDADALSRLPGVLGRHALGERHRLEIGEGELGAVISGIERAGGRVLSVLPVRQSLEDLFYREIGEERRHPRWTGED